MSTKAQIQKVEKKFLAYLFSDKRYIASSLGNIKKEHLPNTNYIYQLLTGYYNKYKGIITDEIVDIMFQKKNIDVNTIVSYKSLIAELRSMPVANESEFEALVEELNEYRKREEYMDIAKNILETNPIECSSDALDKMENMVKEKVVLITADTSDVRKEGTIKDSVDERKERYSNIKNNPETVVYIPTGFKKIDNTEGGFRYGELVYVIGRKGDGKSVLMLNLAHNAWAGGKNVILFSLEISKEDYERRLDARSAGVSSNGLKRGTLTEVEEALYNKYLDGLKRNETPDGKKAGVMYIVDVPSRCSPAFIESKMDTIEQQLGIKFDMVFADYAGIMIPNVPVTEKRHEQGQIALDLKRLARSRECVVVSAAQMTRKGKEDSSGKDGKVGTEHVAESDQISDHIDWGIAIRSVSDMTGKIESFKTRDAAPFEFTFNKKYSKMMIEELDDSTGAWDNLGGPM